jgi:hypothetical protein
MKIGRNKSAAGKTQVVVLTADPDFDAQVRETFGASDQIVLRVVSGSLAGIDSAFDPEGATVAVIDPRKQPGSRTPRARSFDDAHRLAPSCRRGHTGF